MRENKQIRIIVASHKDYWMPDDEIYVPLLVGAASARMHSNDAPDSSWARDDQGDNISEKNPNYCELTGLYWAWKNLEADYIGLAHYRRHFTMKPGSGSKRKRPISGPEVEELLKKNRVILPKKRRYFIESNYSQYIHAHHREDLDTTREILGELFPRHLEAYDNVMARKSGHRFNMFIMEKDLLDRYCEWLFGILFELEKRLDISGYDENDARVFGFVAERLLDVWLEAENIEYEEIPYVFMEDQDLVKKYSAFIMRKLRG